MRRWKAGLIAGCLTALTLLCGGALVGTVWWTSGGLPAPLSTLLPSGGAAATNRIAVVGEDGNIRTMAPDGRAILELTRDASPARQYRYPTWSPDGRSLAYVELHQEGSLIHLYQEEGEARHQISTDAPPFYLFWSPTGERLAFLSQPEAGDMTLNLLDVAAGAERSERVTEGQPFFFSWNPAGNRLVAHIGRDELSLLEPAGGREPLDLELGGFQAPHWSPDGQNLAFVLRSANNEGMLSVSDADGGNVTELTRQRGYFTFNWSPDSRQIAYSFTPFRPGLPAFGPLWVRELATGQAWELSKEPVIAFFWSPDGKRLAFLRPELGRESDPVARAAPLRQSRRLWLRWHIWDGTRTYPLVRFSPSEPFLLEYLRFFDQYAQSISLWSPDGQSLLYAGESESGQAGIWVVPVAEGSTPRHLARGVLASWSPR